MRDRKASDAKYLQQPEVKLWRRIYYRYYMREYRKKLKDGLPMKTARDIARNEANRIVNEKKGIHDASL